MSTTTTATIQSDVTLEAYCRDTGLGILRINGTGYAMSAIRNKGKTVGVRLARYEGDSLKVYDIDMSQKRWVCDCPDATYRPDREHGCKHCVALRTASKQLKGG